MSNKPKSKMPTEEEIKSWQKIPFKIIHVSSEDENHSIKASMIADNNISAEYIRFNHNTIRFD